MKKTMVVLTMAAVLGANPFGGAIRAEAGLATGPIGRLAGELVITGDDEIRQAAVTAATTYSPATRTGTAVITIKQGTARLAQASGEFAAETAEAALGGVTSLAMVITGGNLAGPSTVRFNDVQFSGDSGAFARHAEGIEGWWDAKASLAAPAYRSPRPNLANLGKLQLNVWGTTQEGGPLTSVAILFFDNADPMKIVGGTVHLFDTFVTVSGHLEKFNPDLPGRFLLHLDAPNGMGEAIKFGAMLAIDTQADGTIDVRGTSSFWLGAGRYVVEGIGSAKFVVPTAFGDDPATR
jgi:hypothetical protein